MGLRCHPPIRLEVSTRLELEGYPSIASWYSFEWGEFPQRQQRKGLNICDWHQTADTTFCFSLSVACGAPVKRGTLYWVFWERQKHGEIRSLPVHQLLPTRGLHQKARGCRCVPLQSWRLFSYSARSLNSDLWLHSYMSGPGSLNLGAERMLLFLILLQ